MAATYISEGDTTEYTPGADVTAGDVIVQNELVGIAKQDIKANELGSLAHVGIAEFPKVSGTAISMGVPVYWLASPGVATPSSGSGANKLIGKAVEGTLAADLTIKVRMSQ